MLDWLSTKEVDAFADSVVADLRRRFPPEGIEVEKKKDVQRVMKGVDQLLGRVQDFARASRLNFYKKARFGNRIKWALREARYPAEFADEIAQQLITHLVLASREGARR